MPVEKDRLMEEFEKDKKKILLLGAYSHLASHIFVRLMENPLHEVTIIDRKDPNAIFENPDSRKYKGAANITLKQLSQWDFQYDFLTNEEKPQVVINCLHVHDLLYSHTNPVDTQMTNSIFTTALMDTLQKWGYDGKVIHISSDKVYGFVSDSELPIKEDKVIPKPVGDRALSRYCQEVIVKGMCDKYGISHAILRVGTVFGGFTPSDKAINQWILSILQNEPVIIHGPSEFHGSVIKGCSRDWVHAWDAAGAVKRLVSQIDKKTPWNDTYNIGGMTRFESYISNTAEMIYSFLKPMGTSSRIRYGPWRSSAEEKKMRIWMNCDKAKAKFGYDCDRGILFGSVKENAIWNAHYLLDWTYSDPNYLKLERLNAIFNKEREVAVKSQYPDIYDRMMIDEEKRAAAQKAKEAAANAAASKQ